MTPKINFEEVIGYLLFRAHRVMANKLFQNLNQAGFEITPEQWMLLVNLWQKDGINQNEVARNCAKDKTTITRAVHNLEKLGLVVRMKNKNDARNNHIYLTDKARALSSEVIPVIKKTINEAQSGIDKNDMEITKETLRKIYNNLSPHETE